MVGCSARRSIGAETSASRTSDADGRRTLSMITSILRLVAADYSFLYLLLRGRLGGAILIFVVAEMLGQ